MASPPLRLVQARLTDSLDPMENLTALPIQNSVDRARNQAQHHFTRNFIELKRIQTERQFQNEYFPFDAAPHSSAWPPYPR